MTLGQMLREARQKKGWSLQEAAVQLGTVKGHLHDMERGRALNPTLNMIRAFVLVYGFSPKAIVESET